MLIATLVLVPEVRADLCSLDRRWVDANERRLRIATFNVALFRAEAGQLLAELRQPAREVNAQARAVAEILQRVRPDVVLLNEFDYDPGAAALAAFEENLLAFSQNQQPPLRYRYRYSAPSNTGMLSGVDLNGDGRVALPDDGLGYGRFPGQYAMAVLSMFPIDRQRVRTFQTFLWQDMPNARLPRDYYGPAVQQRLRLSSKSHWDLPLVVDGVRVHLLASHPTPPGFDGPEDRNGRRNADENRLWLDYVSNNAAYLYDDRGDFGGLGDNPRFVIAGDLNADPFDGDDGDDGGASANQLLGSALIQPQPVPRSSGGREDSVREGGANATHRGDPATDTADFNPAGIGNLRIDYLLPSRSGLRTHCSAVFWPAREDSLRRLVGDGDPVVSSDHRLVWLDLEIVGR